MFDVVTRKVNTVMCCCRMLNSRVYSMAGARSCPYWCRAVCPDTVLDQPQSTMSAICPGVYRKPPAFLCAQAGGAVA